MYNIDDADDKHWLYERFVSYWCNSCSTAPLPEYANNEIYQELTKEWNYFKDTSDEKLYIDMWRSKGYTDELEKLTWDKSNVQLTIKLKKSCYKKIRLRVMGYSQTEYYYLLSNKGMIMSYKNYSISKEVVLLLKLIMNGHGLCSPI